MELSELQEIRRLKAEELRSRGIEPYPTRTRRSHTSAEAIALFEAAETTSESDH